MQIELSPAQREAQARYRAFVDATIVPVADQNDREEHTPPELIRALAATGFLGALASQAHGGGGSDLVSFGLLNEALGRGCSSIRSLLTVHSMLVYTLQKWGSRAQQQRWLPLLASGERIGAFGLSEPAIGSDARRIATTATPIADGYSLDGRKKWITYGQIADLFLVFARCGEQPAAFLVPADSPGLTVTPISGMFGTRASMLAELHFAGCRVPAEHRIGGTGFGLIIATSALDIGRYSVAWGSVGIAQACLEASARYAGQREQFGARLSEHQLIRQMLSDMLTNTQAARLLCLNAGRLKDGGDPAATEAVWMAKYFASTQAMRAALDAVQIHGANGCSADYPVQRFLRDAKVAEIIEGSTQIQQITIADFALRAAAGQPQPKQEAPAWA